MDFRGLPDFYETVARDMAGFARDAAGLWVDLGCGAGGVGLALARWCEGVVLLVDPDQDALREALESSRGLDVWALAGRAEQMPLASESADLVVSRGSIFFWQDPVQGIREVYRILRPGGRAMIGGGLGSTYPEWARKEFMRRRRKGLAEEGPGALARFEQKRSPKTFRRIATEAGLPDFHIVGESDAPLDDPRADLGIWLQFSK